jgi:hypothetical protein
MKPEVEMEIQEILKKVKTGEITVEEAALFFRRQPFEEMGFAKLDTHRRVRSGFAEVIFCSDKADSHLLTIFQKLYEEDGGGAFGSGCCIRRHWKRR